MVDEQKKRPGKPPTAAGIAKIRKLHSKGETLNAIHLRLGISRERVKSALAGKYDAQRQQETLSRSYINEVINRIRGIFKWGVSKELVDVAVHHRLMSLAPLKKGRCRAPEASRQKKKAIDPDHVDAVLPHVSSQIAAMIQLQRLTGMRPGEVCRMRACELDMSGDVWVYSPEKHKTAHHDRERRITLGPRSQLILRPFLTTHLTRYLFSPREALEARSRQLRKKRKTKVQSSQQNRRKRCRRNPPNECYTPSSYRVAIQRACRDKARIPAWSPYDLRHLHATEVRERFDEEAAQISLGHKKMETTAIYGERNLARAKLVAQEIG